MCRPFFFGRRSKKKARLVGGRKSSGEEGGKRSVRSSLGWLAYLLTGVQRIWSSFRTQRESATVKEATCLPSSRAITMLWSAAWAVTEASSAARSQLLSNLVMVIFGSSVMRAGLVAMYGGGPVWLIEELPAGLCEIHASEPALSEAAQTALMSLCCLTPEGRCAQQDSGSRGKLSV